MINKRVDRDECSIRPYSRLDQNSIIKCIIELQNFERTLQPRWWFEGSSLLARRYLRYLLLKCRNNRGEILIADFEGNTAGFICVWMEREAEEILTNLNEYAYVSDLIILPEYRGLGIGGDLLREAERYAKKQQAKFIKLEVLPENELASDIYYKEGFKAKEIVLFKELESTIKGLASEGSETISYL